MARIEKVGRSYASALRMYVGMGRRWSITKLSLKTGIARRTLRAYLADETRPSADKHELLCAALGDGFRALVDVERGYVSLSIEASADPADYHILLSELDAELTRRWRDKVFCHKDHAETAPMIARVSMMGLALARKRA